MIPVYTKDPQAVENFGIDWVNVLGEDSISSSSWTVDSGITKDSTDISGTQAIVVLSGGTAGQSYQAVNRIVTTGGKTHELSLKIAVVQK